MTPPARLAFAAIFTLQIERETPASPIPMLSMSFQATGRFLPVMQAAFVPQLPPPRRSEPLLLPPPRKKEKTFEDLKRGRHYPRHYGVIIHNSRRMSGEEEYVSGLLQRIFNKDEVEADRLSIFENRIFVGPYPRDIAREKVALARKDAMDHGAPVPCMRYARQSL